MANPFTYIRNAIRGGIKLEDALTRAASQYDIEGATYNGEAGGTVDAITATTGLARLQNNALCVIRASGANTSTAPTFSPDGLTAKTITKLGNQSLVADDIFGTGHRIQLQYDSTNDVWELLNPA